tara:strand:- start:823 stop:1329 length:507 start_codon:yes stop_codon:yes gene_type:complete
MVATDSMGQWIQYLQGQQPSDIQSGLSTIPYLQYGQKVGSYTKAGDQIAKAMTNMDNPMYQKLYQQFGQQGKANLAESIAEMSRQNRKLSALGRNPLFDQERGGEALFRGLNQGYQDVQNNASQNAFTQLGNAYTANATQGALKQQNALQNTNAMSNVFGALGKVFGL